MAKLHQNKQPLYWQSIEDLQPTPESLEARTHEFKAGVTDDFDPEKELTGVSRRRFLAAVGASAAFALTSCKSYLDRGKVVPYNKQPEEIVVGRPNYYASVVKTHDDLSSVLVKTREGRPINLKGNPDSPVQRGHISSQFVGSIMGLYDPERLSAPQTGDGNKAAWKEIDDAVIKALQSGKKAAFVMHRPMSPALQAVLQELMAEYSELKTYHYSLFHRMYRDNAWKKSYGSDVFPAIHWDQADVILALESDFLGVEGNIETQYLYAQRRDIMQKTKFNRLYVAEGNLSLTGINADYRMRLRTDAQDEFARALLNELAEKGLPVSADVKAAVSGNSLKAFATKYNLKFSEQLVKDLLANQGKALVYAGDKLPESTHLVVNAINEALGSQGLYNLAHTPVQYQAPASAEDWQALIADMKAGNLGLIAHLDSNPVYHLPQDSGYADALAKVPLVVTLSTHENESSAKSKYVLPIHHDLEAWGDYKLQPGVHYLQQPVVQPLHDSRQLEGILLAWKAGDPAAYNEKLYHGYLVNYWQTKVYPQAKPMLDFKTFWNTALHDGMAIYQEALPTLGSFKSAAVASAKAIKAGSGQVVVLYKSHSLGDGEFANNGWLQELAHPASKVVWSNYAAMSRKTAEALGVRSTHTTNDKITVQAGSGTVEVPVLIQPGLADDVIAIELGYGREKAGTIGSGVGYNANLLLSVKNAESPWILSQASVSKASGSVHLVSTQTHHSFDVPREQDLHFKRKILHEANYNEYLKDPHVAEMHVHKPFNVTNMHEYPEIKWAMAIDANKCTGCASCLIACNVENNVPVVGVEQVDRGREMYWIRIDRYYSGDQDDPSFSQQVMLCQHCDNAPCEVVCPVNATNHSPDGLNQMAYNRCVGTRYCSNNCHYKVRRFNFYDYRKTIADAYYGQDNIHQLQHNPEVTVRSRGVMEKCSFCVQRIMWARQEATREQRALKGSDVRTACQEACPSEAIIFGDANDSQSDISKYRKHVAGYHVLEEMNARPNVTYIAKLRNTDA